MEVSIKRLSQGYMKLFIEIRFIGARGVRDCSLLTFKLEFQDFICYKIPVLLSSEYFRNLIKNNYKTEKNPVIDLKNEDARAMYNLLTYLNFANV